jgi:putative GTP pyrophosphokinase
VEVLTNLDQYRSSFFNAYEHVVARLRGLSYEATGRPAKSTSALVEKLKRQNSRLSQIQDIAGCRVIVEDLHQQAMALQAMEVYLDTPVVIDRRIIPSSGYRAIHLIASFQGRKVEVQLRTEMQHLWAEISEKLSDTYGSAIKYGGGDAKVLLFLENLSTSIQRIESEERARMDFMANLKLKKIKADKRTKKVIRGYEREFFSHRAKFLQLVRDAHDEFAKAEVS